MKIVKFTTFLMIAILFMSIVIYNLTTQTERNERLQGLTDENSRLQQKIDAVEKESARYKQKCDELNEKVSKLQSQLEKKMDRPDRGSERPVKVKMKATAYDLSYRSCGKLPDDPLYGITASGKRVKEWHTIAAGKELPFGTKVYIPAFQDMPNTGIFTVEDRGGAIDNGEIDIYMESNRDCMEFGVQELDAYILKEANT